MTFKPKYLDLLIKEISLDIIKPFFENFLPSVFGMKSAAKASKRRKSNSTRKRKKSEDELVLQWVKKLEQIDALNRGSHGELTINFREYFMTFNKRLENETYFQIKEHGMNNYSNDGQDESNQHKKQRQDDEMISINMNLNEISVESDYYQY